MVQAQGQAHELALPSALPVPVRVGPKKRSAAWRILKDQPLGAASSCVLLVVLFCALFAEAVAPQDPLKQSIRDSLQPPGFVDQAGMVHWLGTDGQGRDVLSRLIFGARISLGVGVGAVLVGTLGGLILGVICGYRGGPLDLVVQRITDSMQAIPTLILAMMLVAIFGKDLSVTALAIGITQIPRANRIIRSDVFSVRQEQYIESARTVGARDLRILIQHILPNIVATTTIVFSTSIGAAIVTESTLSFLGLAAPPPLATWGGMLTADGRQYMLVAPWLLLSPAVALSATVLAFNFLGDSIRDILDPKLRGR